MKKMINQDEQTWQQQQPADSSPVMKLSNNETDNQLRLIGEGARINQAPHRNHLMTDHLIKLTMFLCVALITNSQHTPRANCQTYSHHQHAHPHPHPQHNQYFNHNQRLNQMIRPHQQAFARHFRHEAERRASGQVNTQQQQASDNQGKVLVCYYTTRGQSAPYWPSDTSGYVIPADQLNGENVQPPELAPGGPPTELRQESGFAPIVAAGPQKNGFLAQQNQQRSGNQQQQQLDPLGYSYAKNQQQQLVFKSSINAHQPILMMPPSPGLGKSVGQQTFPSSSSPDSNNGLAGKSRKQDYQDAASQLLTADQNSISVGNNAFLAQQQQQQTLIFAGKNGGKQAVPSYSLVGNGDLEASGGLVAAGGQALPGSSGHGGNNGDNGGFIISGSINNGIYNNHQQQQSEKSSTKQQQQLVFQQSTGRAFGASGAGATNNEVLDTKSQLFNPHSSPNNNRYLHQYQTNTHELQLAERQKGKSLQSLATSGNELHQLTPMMHQHQHHSQAAGSFSGAVSSTPPVPLSQASTSAVSQLLASTATTTTTTAAAGTTYARNSQQSNFLPSTTNNANTNQLIVGNGPTQTTQKSQQTATTNSMNSLSPTKLPCQTPDCPQPPSSSGKQSPPASGRAAGAPTSPVASNSQPALQLQQQQLNQPQPGASLSSALASSPLSTMFDVFGAASQYLMRFKPSSLISPSSFVFNTIQSDNHHGLKTGNSSLLGNLATSHAATGAGSMIPLPYVPTNAIAQQVAKFSSASAATNQAATTGEENSGDQQTWSRFSLLNGQQRREDVCGRTIQTPQRRIIGGEGARYGEFPYQVHIKIAKHQCGGALVDRQSIVTAAHCVYHFITRAPVNKLQIVIGAYDIEDEQYQELPPQYFKVNKVKLHPNFRFSASHPDRYDIAILKLDKPVKYTDNVLPVCLPSKDIKYESLVGTVTGFGKTDPSLSNRYGTRLLQKVDVPIIENNECERWHRTRGIDLKIFPEMMCAGYEDGLKDACVGDSGGPLVVKTASGPNGAFRWTLAGITSAGFGCAQSRQPGIYHRVSHTVDWILENLD